LAAVALSQSAVEAAPFLYRNGDVVIGFRKSGATYDLEINLGSVTNFINAPAGSTITNTNVTASILKQLFGTNVDNVEFGAIACARIGDASTNIAPASTVWATSPRANSMVRSDPWLRFSASVLGNAAAKVESIGNNATNYSAIDLGGTASATNTASLVVVADSSPESYNTFMGAGNIGGTFQGLVEQLTPASFSSGSVAVRSDFYDIRPGSGNATYLGYFQLTPAGVFTFNAAGGFDPNPITMAVGRTNTVNTILFNTDSGYHYTLYYTNSPGLTATISQWGSLTPVVGTGSPMSINDDSAGATNRVYIIGVSP